ncbi:hypothetical protein BDV18DRAFT_161835 [Aspergillus unguis]
MSSPDSSSIRSKVVIVGAGFYGLITAKTYLQVTGCYTAGGSINPRADAKPSAEENDVLIIDSANDIGGTWAKDRLYPNLLTQNSYGYYEFSDLPLTDAVPDDVNEKGERENAFIPGWKLNQYLQVWSRKWDLQRRTRLNWKVTQVSRLPSKEWRLEVVDYSKESPATVILTCDKLVLATGLTSKPNMPDIPHIGDQLVPEIHAKDVGQYCRENLGYQPIPQPMNYLQPESPLLSYPKSVVVYGGAKSAFDIVHLFGSLHRKREEFHLEGTPIKPVQVHWVIREDRGGPAWMMCPTAKVTNKVIPSDQAAYMRMVGAMDRFVYEVPKRLEWPWGSIPRLEGSWLRRLIHENRLGRAVMRQVWKGVDADIRAFAKYDAQPKMQKLLPKSVNDCTGPGGIANHSDLWETIRGPNVHIHRSSIAQVNSTTAAVELANKTHLPSIDLIVHATGWKQSMAVPLDPPELAAELGLPYSPTTDSDSGWDAVEERVESKMKSIFDPALFEHATTSIENRYRLFRRQASPALIAEGDRSFAVVGVGAQGAVALSAEVQALWVAAFLTGGLDGADGPLNDLEKIKDCIAEDVVWGRLTSTGLAVNALQSNDILMRDVGLDPNRMGGGWWKEMTAVYGPSSYAGIVDEWMELQEKRDRQVIE